MYDFSLFLHNYLRWLILAALAWALFRAWYGWMASREWTVWDKRAGLTLAILTTVQLILGIILFLHPRGVAQAAWYDISVAMKIFDLRFFGLEHPLQMTIAIVLIHVGYHRAQKRPTTKAKHRWAAIFFTLSTMAILTAIPWWRPLIR